MKHLDLFSGIGGFAYAMDQVWDAEHTFVEIDPFCQKILKKHWPNAKIYQDIRDIRETTIDSSGISIVTGGFPCQPFSHAGVRKGVNDDRNLWPEMLRVIQLTKPTWIVAENVRGLVSIQGGLVFEQVCADLENEGYEAQSFIIPAAGVNAPHKRDRVWIIANSTGGQREQYVSIRKEEGRPSEGNQRNSWKQDWVNIAARLCRVDDGLSRRMDRTNRLKTLGNAIVPQIAVEIFKAIDNA